MALDESVGERIAYFRKLQGMSAQKLADESGLTRPVIVNIELGRREDIAWKELLAIAIALRVTPVALVLPIERPFERVELGGWSTTPHAIRRWIAGETSLPDAPESSVTATRLISTADQVENARLSLEGTVSELARRVNDEATVRAIVAGDVAPPDAEETVRDLVAQLPFARERYEWLVTQFTNDGGTPPTGDPVLSALRRAYG